jgi:hypothetical protein
MRAKRIRIPDHFSYSGVLQIANIQPEIMKHRGGLVQVNYFRRGNLQSSADVYKDDLFEAIEALYNVTITPKDHDGTKN